MTATTLGYTGSASASADAVVTDAEVRPGTNEVARPAFFASLGLDDTAVEPQEGYRTDPVPLAWLKAELDTELRGG